MQEVDEVVMRGEGGRQGEQLAYKVVRVGEDRLKVGLEGQGEHIGGKSRGGEWIGRDSVRQAEKVVGRVELAGKIGLELDELRVGREEGWGWQDLVY
ncbi:hypothetical protein Pcinc_022971 [Petrolisthes cinctipes]|uniref:Uncharacterized protein n=1 Tax=Petrolisthes cinctipes TaxID=88211 RepID=A0AAE1FFA5_PETCI|nr:hypothetical protein Pcinc_022971 [Petrolisthes cinctipes]